MSTPSHDDLGPGAATQGGAPDAEGVGPARVQGRSIWWIAAVAVVAVVVAWVWFTGRPLRAPAEAGKASIVGASSGVAQEPSAASHP